MTHFKRTSAARSAALIALGGIMLGACNSKEKEEEYAPATSVAVSAFKLKEDDKVTENLDSVFFSIDLDHGVIFNADSLPVGTDVTKLVPVITYPSTVTSATIVMQGGKRLQGTADYFKSPADTLDFSGTVTLTLGAADNSQMTYDIRVNVHRQQPDTLMWAELAMTDMPSRLPAPVSQKTVSHDGKALSMIAENDGSYTIASTPSPDTTPWIKTAVTPGFNPDIRTLTSAGGALYMLSTAGELFSSEEGTSWSSTGQRWTSVIGAYADAILGIREADGKMIQTSWPAAAGLPECSLPASFPLKGATNFVTASNRWASSPTGLLCGGTDAAGNANTRTWAFDGERWETIDLHPAPAAQGAVIVPYYIYTQTSTFWLRDENNIWVMLGGTLPDGKPSATVYISYDNGVNWQKAPLSMQLPAKFPQLSMADALVIYSPMQASLADYWKKLPDQEMPPKRRLKYEVDGYDIRWECPSIYIFGGITKEGELSDAIMRGTLARLTHTPLI